MGFVQNNNVVIEQIGIIYALSYEHPICNISDLSRFFSFVIKSDSVSDLLPQCGSSFDTDSAGHTHGSHTTRLSADYFYLGYWLNGPFYIFFYKLLIF